MKSNFVAAASTFLLSISLMGAASEHQDPLAVLTPLKGKWLAQPADGTKPIEVTYAYASKNTVLTEYFGKELTVFYRDGEQVLLTHFCNVGNQPRLKLNADHIADTLTFEYLDATNLSHPDAAHVNAVTYHFRSADLVDATWTWTKGGVLSSERYLLKRLPEVAADSRDR